MLSWIRKAWRGEEKLWKVFWYPTIFWIVLALLMALIFGGYALLVKNLGWHIENEPYTAIGGGSKPATIWWITFCVSVFASSAILIAVWQNVALWRCAWNASLALWGLLAKIWVILSWLGLIINIVKLASEMPILIGNKEPLFKYTCVLNIANYAKEKGYITKMADPEIKEYINQRPEDFEHCIQNLRDEYR